MSPRQQVLTNKKEGNKAEARVAESVGATLVPGSGCGCVNKGDFTDDTYCYQHKLLVTPRITSEWLVGCLLDASNNHKKPCIVITDKETLTRIYGAKLKVMGAKFLKLNKTRKLPFTDIVEGIRVTVQSSCGNWTFVNETTWRALHNEN